jgi:hypothetical protein
MAENNAATNQGAAFDHERWLTLRAAYNRYKGASATLGALTAASLVESSSPVRNQAIEAAAAEQRTAFENYIEARLALSESMAFPAQGWRATDGNDSSEQRKHLWRHSRISRTVLLAAAVVAWLLPAALSVENWMGQRRQAQDLETVRDETNILMAQATDQVAAFSQTAEIWKAAPQATMVRNSGTPTTGVKKTVRPGQTPGLRPTRRGRRIAKNRQKWVLLD